MNIEELRTLSKTGRLSSAQRDAEVESRRKMRAGMVGQLYPSILTSEILEIQNMPSVESTEAKYSQYHWARKPNGDKLHAFALPLKADELNIPVCRRLKLWRDEVSSPRHNDMPRCKDCVRWTP